MKRRMAAMLLCALMCLAVACVPADPALPMAGKEFAMVVKSGGNKYFDEIVAGFSAVIEAEGGEALVMEPDTASAEEQITIIEGLINRRVDCIAIAANSEKAVEPILSRAIGAGIAVLSFDSSVSAQSRALHVNQVNAAHIARKLMDAAADIADGEARIAILSTTSQAHNQNLWIEEMRRLLEGGEYPGLMLVDIVYGQDDYDVSYQKTRQLIEDYPELSAVIVPTAAGMPAAARCILDAGLEGEIKITGLGLPSQMAEFVGDEGVCPYLFLWDTRSVGKLTAYAALSLVEGSISGSPGERVPAGNLGDYVITEDQFGGSEVVLNTEPLRFDQGNIGEWAEKY